jgi:hypothetical protein
MQEDDVYTDGITKGFIKIETVFKSALDVSIRGE